MPISTDQYMQMVARLQKQCPTPKAGAGREVGKGGLHEKIMNWCDMQWPRWAYVHNRTDKPSTVAIGVCDFIIAAPGGRVLFIECKAKGKKRTPAQLAWALKLEMLGHVVPVVYSMGEFLGLTDEIKALNKIRGTSQDSNQNPQQHVASPHHHKKPSPGTNPA